MPCAGEATTRGGSRAALAIIPAVASASATPTIVSPAAVSLIAAIAHASGSPSRSRTSSSARPETRSPSLGAPICLIRVRGVVWRRRVIRIVVWWLSAPASSTSATTPAWSMDARSSARTTARSYNESVVRDPERDTNKYHPEQARDDLVARPVSAMIAIVVVAPPSSSAFAISLLAFLGQDELVLHTAAAFQDIRIVWRVVAFTNNICRAKLELVRK